MRPRRPPKPGGRNFNDPRYVAWRKAVRARDHHKCRRCGSKARLQAHHIRGWEEAPLLRFAVGNGILLCAVCHKMMSGNESTWAPLCLTLIRQQG